VRFLALAKAIKVKVPITNNALDDGSGIGDGENDAEKFEAAGPLLSITMDDSTLPEMVVLSKAV